MESTVNFPIKEKIPEKLPVIETTNLGKSYRTGFWMNQKIESLKNCNLTVYQGETFGLLGQNGAGKTTLLKTLLGIIRPTSGEGTLLGQPIGDRLVKEKIGYLPENPYFYDYLTGWEFLEFVAGLFQISKSIQKQIIPELLDLVGLSKSAAIKKQLRQYSKGMLQRVGMAQALINDPELVFLDEPMSGLDPMGRYQIREIIVSLKEKGKTIFFNSHVLSDVEKVCDRIAILVAGELICIGTLDEVLGINETYYVKGKSGNIQILKQWIPDLEFENNFWQGHLQGDPQEFLVSLGLMKATLINMNIEKISLEEYFMQKLRERGIFASN
ncbi:ABC transporter ATP-binding protein [Okeania sp.]|uniref:ABC transporter ATP-binding protein n=1 Tax=Okeania sp. TaxID=3100323 RepID=UPI002B4AADEC|nr:ABC transporter ATP-binding protein [Okeania sp.]MEB3342665.1 ABC transporter ATP-binding protein [Okeania sp.]